MGTCQAVHAMHQVFQSPDTECVILVEAFNYLNRESALLYLCPPLYTYRDNVQL